MEKEQFQEPEMNIIWFESEDVIATSSYTAEANGILDGANEVLSGLSSFWSKWS